MKIIYTAPNRGHHYRYASILDGGGILHKFISGFSRMSPRSSFRTMRTKLVRADWLQTIYLLSLKLGSSKVFSSNLAYFAKIEQDFVCRRFIREADIFLFYSGSGLKTCEQAIKYGKITVVEAVNSHVEYQEAILKSEYDFLKIPWIPFHKKEQERRVKEYELADYMLLPSEFVRKSFLDLGFPSEKLIKVPYGFEKLSAERLSGISSERENFTILYVGSISIRKGIRYLIDAFVKLQHPKKRLVIVGPLGNPSGIEDMNIPEGVTFTGVLKGRDLDNIYCSASVFCLPSIEEGLALVLGEAISFGVPIIATENTGASDLINNGKEGFIVPIRDSDSIARKLQLLADDPELIEQIRVNVIEKSKNLDGWDKTGSLLMSSLFEIYKRHQIKRL